MITVVDRTGDIARSLREVREAFSAARCFRGAWLTVRLAHVDAGTRPGDDDPPVQCLDIDSLDSVAYTCARIPDRNWPAGRDSAVLKPSVGHRHIDFKSLVQVAHVGRARHRHDLSRDPCLPQQGPPPRFHLLEDRVQVGEVDAAQGRPVGLHEIESHRGHENPKAEVTPAADGQTSCRIFNFSATR